LVSECINEESKNLLHVGENKFWDVG
jgi:hypothetical protein